MWRTWVAMHVVPNLWVLLLLRPPFLRNRSWCLTPSPQQCLQQRARRFLAWRLLFSPSHTGLAERNHWIPEKRNHCKNKLLSATMHSNGTGCQSSFSWMATLPILGSISAFVSFRALQVIRMLIWVQCLAVNTGIDSIMSQAKLRLYWTWPYPV